MKGTHARTHAHTFIHSYIHVALVSIHTLYPQTHSLALSLPFLRYLGGRRLQEQGKALLAVLEEAKLLEHDGEGLYRRQCQSERVENPLVKVLLSKEGVQQIDLVL